MTNNGSRLESDQPRVVAAPRVITPTLNVLLGSTAALAGLEVMRQMLALQPQDQRKVALVYIDTDDPPAPLVEFRSQYNNVFQEFPLRIAVPTGISNADHIDETDQHTFIQKKVPQHFANGAGGIRNNGHVAACFNYQYIYDVLDRAIVAISHLGLDQNAVSVHEVQANIVAFLGGGTGSGTIADIAVIVRDLLAHRQYKQRLNLFCLLPEPINGVNPNDLSWRKSNATAGLLEILAYSRAAAPNPTVGYQKFMRRKVHRLTNDPIANEVYLIGHSSMPDTSDTARIVGLDLYQRIADGSSVGFLEHSKYVDRRTLGASDKNGLPTMFGTSCPMVVRFPAMETARAFAQISASYMLTQIASYQPLSTSVGEAEQRDWMRKWNSVARFDANAKDPHSVKITEFRRADFEAASQAQLDVLWGRLERFEQATELRIKEIVDAKSREESNLLKRVPQQDAGQSLIDQRIRHLRQLVQEYSTVLDSIRERERARVPGRPLDLEDKLVRQPRWPALLQNMTRDYAGAVCEAYNERIRLHARTTRIRLLEHMLKDLKSRAQDALNQSLSWFRDIEVEESSRVLRDKGMESMAWQGKLEYPHPHQRHLFDLKTLRTIDGHNVAVEQLYIWATGGDTALKENRPLDYSKFVKDCVAYLAQYTPSSAQETSTLSIDDQIAGKLADRVVDFFQEYYLHQFEDINLFELLNKAAPVPKSGQTRVDQINDYIREHMEHVRHLMRSLVTFEAQLWTDGLSTLDSSLYLGIHWHDGHQEEMLQQVLKKLGSLTREAQMPAIQISYDPHRLDIVYSQHALSLNTVRDFYLEENSAMQYYQGYQAAWKDTHGNGLMPVHSSGEAQRLVCDANALGYSAPLVDLVIRSTSSHNGTASKPASNGTTIPPTQDTHNSTRSANHNSGNPPQAGPPPTTPDAGLPNSPFGTL